MVSSSPCCCLRNSRHCCTISSMLSGGRILTCTSMGEVCVWMTKPCWVQFQRVMGNCGCACAGCSASSSGTASRCRLGIVGLSFQLLFAEFHNGFKAICQDVGPIGFSGYDGLVERRFCKGDDLLCELAFINFRAVKFC